MGKVIATDGLTITVAYGNIQKSYTYFTFYQWCRIVDDEGESEQAEVIVTTDKDYVPEITHSRVNPSGEPGIGKVLSQKFITLVREMAVQSVEIIVAKNGDYRIKYNGRNVFVCIIANRRFNVFCHPNSLSPINRTKVTKLYPKKWNWSLRAKFVFTSMDEVPLMKSIITDGLFYRQVKEELKMSE